MATVKRKTAAKTATAKKSYVSRSSQVTKKKPTKRLTERRAKNLKAPKGVFPNPVNNVKEYVVFQVFYDGNIENRVAGFVKKSDAVAFAKNMKAEGKRFIVRPVTLTGTLAPIWPVERNPAEIHIDVDSHNAKGAKSRTKTNPVKRGVTSRPSKAKRAAVYLVESSEKESGPWETQGIFPSEAKARNYAEALAASYPDMWFRVVLK